MSRDPFAVFRAGTGGRQNTLKTIWPDLYAALADVESRPGGNLRRCVLASHEIGQGPPAVGRIGDKYGHTACQECLDRFGGPTFPLIVERS